MKRLLLSTMFYLLCQCVMLAQGMIVTGTVVDPQDEPMPGVLIEVIGRSETATTDIDGRFKLDVPENVKKIRVSYPGFKAMEVNVKPEMYIRFGSGWGATPSGYRGFFDIQGGFGFGGRMNVDAGDMLIKDIGTLLTFGINYTAGYQINQNLFVGIGFGFHADMTRCRVFDSYPNYDNKFYAFRMPVYADVRWDFGLTKKTAPYVALKAGYQFSVPFNDDDRELAWADYYSGNYQRLTVTGKWVSGLLLQPSIGMRTSIGGKKGINLGLAYDICLPRKMKAVYSYSNPGSYYYGMEDKTIDMGVARGGALKLNIGIDF